MPTLYVANFDIDDRLARPELGTLPKSLRAINARLAPLLRGLCGPGDAAAAPGDWVPDAGRFDRVEPWGVEPHVLRWLGGLGVRPEALDTLPDPAAVRAVNSRHWQWEIERALGLASGRATLCESEIDVFDAARDLADHPRGLVLKGEFGGSGRSVRFAPAGDPRWAAGVLARGQCVTVEPRDDADAEISAHLTVTGDGVTFDGLCTLRSSRTGQFRSVEPLGRPAPALLEPASVWAAVAERARADGYRGFLGIDAAVRDGAVIRPVRDVNARWTMGRVALTTGRAVTNP